MKKLFVLIVVVVFGTFLAGEFGLISIPYLSGKALETAQRAFGRGRRQAAKLDEIPVLTSAVRRQDVPVTLDAVGTVQALNTVIVRTQVDGRLMELTFRDGQDVKKNDVLARIDPSTYQAAYDQAVGKKAQDEAQLANARIDLDRYDKLAASNFGSRQQADTQRATVAQLVAQLRVDQAQIDSARATLDYTTIVAPIDGRTGLRAVDAGNIVRAADTGGLVTITQMNPIAAIFSLPQQQLRAVIDATAHGVLSAEALEADNVTVIEKGQLEVIDNLVDSTTGTVRVRAVFPNEGRHLWPGQFVNIRLLVSVDRQALVVPTGAIQRGPRGAYVYVVGDDSKASMQLVTVNRQDDKLAMLAGGLEPGQRVVTTGFNQLTDGATVRATDADAPQPAADAAAPAEPRTPRRGPPGDGSRRRQGQGQTRGDGQGQNGQRNGQAGPPRTTEAGTGASTQ